jgi:hypothetical protein
VVKPGKVGIFGNVETETLFVDDEAPALGGP